MSIEELGLLGRLQTRLKSEEGLLAGDNRSGQVTGHHPEILISIAVAIFIAGFAAALLSGLS